MHSGRVDEGCYVDGKHIGPAAKTELQLWLERLRIPEGRALEYTMKFEEKGFDDLQALIEDAVPNDLVNIGMLDGHLKRVEKDLEKLRLDWFKDAPIDDRLLTVVVFQGRNVPSALTPAQLSETVLYSILPPAAGETQLTEIQHNGGDMAVLQMPLGGAYYGSPSGGGAIGGDGGGAVDDVAAPPPHIVKASSPSPVSATATALASARLDVSESITGGERRDHVGLNPNVREWGVEDVVAWICQFEPLRSKAYVAEIRRQRVDGEGLLSVISLPQIEKLGIKLLPHKKKLLQEIQTLRKTFIGAIKAETGPSTQREVKAKKTTKASTADSMVAQPSSPPSARRSKEEDIVMAPPTAVGSGPRSPLTTEGSRAYVNEQMASQQRRESGDEGGSSRRRVVDDTKETPRWGPKGTSHNKATAEPTSRLPASTPAVNAPSAGVAGALGFADDLDAFKPDSQGGGGVELNATYEFKKGVLKASGFQIEPSGITHIPEDRPPSARVSYDEGPSPRTSELSASYHPSDMSSPTAALDTSLQAMISTPRNVRDNLVTMDEVGSGACASVYRAVYLPSLTVVAVKYFPIHDQGRRKQLVQELRSFLPLNWVLLSDTSRAIISNNTAGDDSREQQPSSPPAPPAPKCPHVISFYDAYTDTYSDSVSMVLEYMNGGTLQDLTKRTGGIKDEVIIAWISYQICKGLQEIHSRAQIHRDIKPSNILLNSRGHIKISDFGIARILDDSLALAMTFNGTTMYMAPERLNGDAYSYGSDIWSFGLSIITLATGHTPVPTNEGFWGILRSVKAKPPSLSPTSFSPELCDFVSKCCAVDPKDRSTAEALLHHDFLKNAPTDVPAAFEAYLPPRPVDMNAIPGPKRKIIKSLIEKAVSAKLGKLDDIDEEVQLQSGCSMVPYFRDRHLRGLEEQLRLPVDSVATLFRAELDRQYKRRGIVALHKGSSSARRSRVSTITSTGSNTPDFFRSREPSRSPAGVGTVDGAGVSAATLEEVAKRLGASSHALPTTPPRTAPDAGTQQQHASLFPPTPPPPPHSEDSGPSDHASTPANNSPVPSPFLKRNIVPPIPIAQALRVSSGGGRSNSGSPTAIDRRGSRSNSSTTIAPALSSWGADSSSSETGRSSRSNSNPLQPPPLDIACALTAVANLNSRNQDDDASR